MFFVLINIIYIIILFLYAFFVERRVKVSQRKIIYWFWIAVFSLIMALRPIETPDTLAYIDGFNTIRPGDYYVGSLFQKSNGYEFGFIILIKIFKFFSSNYRVFFFFVAFLSISTITIGLHKLYSFMIPNSDITGIKVLAIYVACYGGLYSGITMRAGLAMGLGLLFVKYVLEKKIVLAIVFEVLAFSIHRSSILFILVFIAICFSPHISTKVHATLWLIMGFILVFGIGYHLSKPLFEFLVGIFNKYSITSIDYLLSIDDTVGKTDIWMWLLYGFFILFKLDNDYFYKYLSVIMLGAVMVTFMYGVRAISRAWDYFYIAMIPLFTGLLEYKSTISSSLNKQQLFVAFIIAVNTIKMFLLLTNVDLF